MDKALRHRLNDFHLRTWSVRFWHELDGRSVTLRERILGALIAIGLLLICFPFAVILTFVTAPIWLWIETRFGIESYGHSGPAEWCYLVMYVLLVFACAMVWARRPRMR